MEFLISAVIVCAVFLVAIINSKIQEKEDREENKSGSSDYVLQRNEDATTIGGTNLDRFFVECVLARCNDFSAEKNVARAKLFADKYNLKYTSGIEDLYSQALHAHENISGKIYTDKLEKQRKDESAEYSFLTKYAEYYGLDKKKAMLTDRMNELRKKSKAVDDGNLALMKSNQIQEKNWAVAGGIAEGIAGPVAGIATAIDVQVQNAQIRTQNEVNAKVALPMYKSLNQYALDLGHDADAIEKRIASLQEKLISETTTSEVMDLLEIVNPIVYTSETGAYKVTATVKVKDKLFIYDDVPAVADGTIQAHIMDGSREIGTAKMVLPVSGVSSRTEIVGMGLVGAIPGRTYTVSFTGYKLWLMES